MDLNSQFTSNEAIKTLLSGVQRQTLPITPKMQQPAMPGVAPSAPKIETVPGAKPLITAPSHVLTQQVGAGKQKVPVPNRQVRRSIPMGKAMGKLGSYKHLESVLAHLDVKPVTAKQAACTALCSILVR